MPKAIAQALARTGLLKNARVSVVNVAVAFTRARAQTIPARSRLAPKQAARMCVELAAAPL